MSVSVTFDGVARIASFGAGTTDIALPDLYSAWKRWIVESDNSKYLPMFRVVGGDPITSDVSLGTTYFLLNGWKIRPYEGDHRLTVAGNLYTDDLSSPFTKTLGNYNVVITMRVSALNEVTEVATSGNTYSLNQIRDAIWQAPVTGQQDPTTMGGWITKKLLTLKQFVGLS